MRLEEGVEFVQAAILLRDTILQPRYRNEERAWRLEDQAWRREDREWRESDLQWREEELRFMNNQKRWRLDDLEQRSLDNARVLWDRFIEKNRRDVEERAEQLKSIGNMAALVAGFAVVSFLEFSADTPVKALEIMFGLTTALVVGLNTQAMIATSLLHASILRSGKLYVDEAAEAEYMRQCLNFVTKFQVGMNPPAPRRTFAQHWETRCEQEWRFAFQLFSAGLVAFICNLMVAAWIKFGKEDIRTPVLVTVTLAICMFGMWRSIALWAPHLIKGTRANSSVGADDTVVQLGEQYGLPFAWHRIPRPVDDDSAHAMLQQDHFHDAPSQFPVTTDAVSSEGSSDIIPVAMDSIGSKSTTLHDGKAHEIHLPEQQRGLGLQAHGAVLSGSGTRSGDVDVDAQNGTVCAPSISDQGATGSSSGIRGALGHSWWGPWRHSAKSQRCASAHVRDGDALNDTGNHTHHSLGLRNPPDHNTRSEGLQQAQERPGIGANRLVDNGDMRTGNDTGGHAIYMPGDNMV